MNTYHRHSPLHFDGRPVQIEERDGWKVVLQYDNEGKGPSLIDLSHLTKWDVQDRILSRIKPAGLAVPKSPGTCALQNRFIICRMNQTQAVVWHLSGDNPVMPQKPAFSDITEAFALLALVGLRLDLCSIMEKITPLDIFNPEAKPPFLIQGPVLRVPCQIVVLRVKDNSYALLIACSRGYGQSMAEAIFDAGFQEGLHPAGEIAFFHWAQLLLK